MPTIRHFGTAPKLNVVENVRADLRVVEPTLHTHSNADGLILDVSQIRPNFRSLRRTFDEQALHELADSIKRWGQLQPVLVRQVPGTGGYELICGERRWRAHQIAGLETIWALECDASEPEMLALALVENLHRADLGHEEKVAALDQLAEVADARGLRKTAQHLGVDPSWLSRQLSVRKDSFIFPALEAGRVGFGQAAELIRAPANARADLLDRVITSKRHVSTATIRAWVDRAKSFETPLQDSQRQGHRENPWVALLTKLESVNAPGSSEDCGILARIITRAQQLLESVETQNSQAAGIMDKKVWQELECLMCGAQAGTLETKVTFRPRGSNTVRWTGRQMYCGRCGGTLIGATSEGQHISI